MNTEKHQNGKYRPVGFYWIKFKTEDFPTEIWTDFIPEFWGGQTWLVMAYSVDEMIVSRYMGVREEHGRVIVAKPCVYES